MKDKEEFSFAMMSTNECELLSYPSDETREYEYTRATIDEKNIIFNKFTECFTTGMIDNLSNLLHINEEDLRIESSRELYQEVWLAECLICGGRVFFWKYLHKIQTWKLLSVHRNMSLM